MQMKAMIAAAVIGLSGAGAAQAAAIFDFREIGSDVVGTLSGPLDLTGATRLGGGNIRFGSLIEPNSGAFLLATPGSAFDTYLATGPDNFGVGGESNPSSATGTDLTLILEGFFDYLSISRDYVSGSEMTGSMTFLGASFVSLGVRLGDYVWRLPNDTFTLRFANPDPAPVPLPASMPLLAVAIGALGWLRRRV